MAVSWTEREVPSLVGRRALVTGANSGIGFAAARTLGSAGARVVLACRNGRRGTDAVDRIRRGNPAADVSSIVLDLGSLRGVRAVAESWEGGLDLLVNNAGVMAPPRRELTAEGFELQFGVNHLGHFALTGLLLPALLRTSSPRVVTVSSLAHHRGTAAVVEGNAGPYSAQQAYGNAKLANLLFAFELQRQCERRGLPLVSTAAHPGVAATGLVTDRQGMGGNPIVRMFAPGFLRLFTASATAGARAVLHAATVAAPGSYTGPQRFGETRGPIGPARISPVAEDQELARRMWQLSEDLTGVRYPWPA